MKMASQSSTQTFETSTNESDIIGFDEIDENLSILRTIIEFEIKDNNDNIISLNDVSENNPGICNGYVLEPLPKDLQKMMFESVSTSVLIDDDVSNRNSNINETTNNNIVGNNIEITQLDRSSLKIGDLIDGYCPKTFQWYEAKIIDIQQDIENGIDNVKVHFQGWNSKYDEWLERQSLRMVAYKTSSYIIQEQVLNASRMVPWFDSKTLLEKSLLRLKFPEKNLKRRRIKVIIPNIIDWCIDYTYGNPTLWLVAGSGVWYRIAGALCPGGHIGSPLKSYFPFFSNNFRKISDSISCCYVFI